MERLHYRGNRRQTFFGDLFRLRGLRRFRAPAAAPQTAALAQRRIIPVQDDRELEDPGIQAARAEDFSLRLHARSVTHPRAEVNRSTTTSRCAIVSAWRCRITPPRSYTLRSAGAGTPPGWSDAAARSPLVPAESAKNAWLEHTGDDIALKHSKQTRNKSRPPIDNYVLMCENKSMENERIEIERREGRGTLAIILRYFDAYRVECWLTADTGHFIRLKAYKTLGGAQRYAERFVNFCA